ncbi:zinc finger BED domain-containing protein RICESLEEPER 2-like [Manihot esculenta]|uniref:zinc finger BED domain-containing protein RICESLEEPER 2-like n=1 Tax=Manihot esculenta TaxID=3983 RepID=UPI001CC6FA93|nr:zinc finger BED domain-containing protein RICESLEEPER 2-like [Manihot esculenta]
MASQNDQMLQNSISGSNQTNTDASTETTTSSKAKRKPVKPRSEVWDHFTKFVSDEGELKGKCNYCKKDFCCDPKRNGTTALRNHLNSCKKHPHFIETRQAQLSLQKNASDNDVNDLGTLTTWKYDDNAIRKALVHMIIIDELPFRFVEGEGFRSFMTAICPRFRIPSRWTISRDCYDLFIEERSKLKSFFKNNCQRVSLTTDTWTSLQRINYMCITAHFIDNDWKLHKRIINFCPISSHKGEAVGRAIETCLLEWGLDKVFTVTVDNASSNDVAISYLKKKLANWGVSVANSTYLHMRCMAHIINLVVQDGLKDVNDSVMKVRDAVRYIRSSPARLKRFKECVLHEKIESKSSLCLDVPTRWNSTYLMLNTAQKYERAFERYESQDPMFKIDMGENGIPDYYDWTQVRKMADMLAHFYELTLRISGSRYVTSNLFFSEVSDLAFILNQWINSNDLDMKSMGERMKVKFDKYWGDVDKMNKIIYFAVVLDPRDKFEFMEYSFSQMYGKEKGVELFNKVKSCLFDLFNEYKKMYQPDVEQFNDNSSQQLSGSCSTTGSINPKPKFFLKHHYKKQKLEESGGFDSKTELEVYLSEAIQEEKDDFDIMKWWKINSERFPILGKMARDILAIPVSTVASESAFSTGGRVLDSFRSSLTPKIVEGLICVQNWIRPLNIQVNVEEDLEELEKLEEDFSLLNMFQVSTQHFVGSDSDMLLKGVVDLIFC